MGSSVRKGQKEKDTTAESEQFGRLGFCSVMAPRYVRLYLRVSVACTGLKLE